MEKYVGKCHLILIIIFIYYYRLKLFYFNKTNKNYKKKIKKMKDFFSKKYIKKTNNCLNKSMSYFFNLLSYSQ